MLNNQLVRPTDKHLMKIGREYSRFVFDTQTFAFYIEFYDRENYRREDHDRMTLEQLEAVRNQHVRERWEFVTQVCEGAGMVFYYQRWGYALE